ncbi:Rhodanese domain protein [Evansella cellulosilytica DSM 2522]|uniref:Rhodanese domain protein n=2 Tax=Evansella TaxID=2837485 RepID=E6TV15_EVAC2|nr:Rhodanese domain protein [Evansella cellulosilytica DSM 2522]
MKNKMIYILPVLLLIGYFGYQYFLSYGIEEISTKELEALLLEENDDYFFVDVREVHEYEEAHIEGMANVPLSRLESTYSSVPKDKTVVIICRSGKRSLEAANILKGKGYDDLVHVKGGMLTWDGEVTS